MRKVGVIAAVALQLAVLAYMAGEREWVLRTGRIIVLRTAPVDPRDAMRGDYVRLRYAMSSVPRSMCEGTLAGTNAADRLPPDTRVYARLRETEDGIAEFVALTDVPPTEGLFVRGRTERHWGGSRIPVRYGLEAYFMEQGRALELEQRRVRDGIQFPLEMVVAVNARGLAVLKSHRWGGAGRWLGNGAVPGSTRPSRQSSAHGRQAQAP